MELISSNGDILYHIFQYLGYEDHFNLVKVCSQFRSVVIELIWKHKYKELDIYRTSQNYIVRTRTEVHGKVSLENKRKLDKNYGIDDKYKMLQILNDNDYKMFAQALAKEIKFIKLEASSSSTTTNLKRSHEGTNKNDNTYYLSLQEFDSTNKFTNLLCVSYKSIIIRDEDLQLLSKYCPTLEQLSLDNCLNVHKNPLVMEDTIKISTIQNMTKLNCFEIVDSDMFTKPQISFHHKFSNIKKMLNNLYIKQITMNVAFYDDDDGSEDDVEADEVGGSLNNICEILKIGYFPNQKTVYAFCNKIINSLPNLQNLTIINGESNSINYNDCMKKLKYLKLSDCSIEPSLKPLLCNNLNNLILINSSGLTWKDIKDIVANKKMKSLCFEEITFNGKYEYLKVTPTLESLDVTFCGNNHMRKLIDMNEERNFENLTSLTWYNNYNELPQTIALNCPKLQTLNTEPCQALMDNLYQLTSLETFTLSGYRNLKSSYILTILKHPSIRYFNLIKLCGDEDYDDEFGMVHDINEDALLEFDNMKTNVLFVNMFFNYDFKIMLNFWFNLLQNNPKLSLMIRYERQLCDNDDQYLKKIVHHENFPKRLKSIKWCGFHIDVNKLKDNFEKSTEGFKPFLKYRLINAEEYILL